LKTGVDGPRFEPARGLLFCLDPHTLKAPIRMGGSTGPDPLFRLHAQKALLVWLLR
jgi:hypothetical protein